MAFRKKSRKKKNSHIDEVLDKVSASDFKVKVATVASFDVSNVTGRTKLGTSKTYTAYLSADVTEVSASAVFNISSVSLAHGHSFSLVTQSPITLSNGIVWTYPVNSTTEVLSAPSSGKVTSGNLTLVSAPTAAVETTVLFVIHTPGFNLQIDDSLSGGGILSGATPWVSGLVDYTVGAWSVDLGPLASFTTGCDISAYYDYTYPVSSVVPEATPIIIRHTIHKDGSVYGTSMGRLSGAIIDATGVNTITSLIFTISGTKPINPWEGKGALPGETAIETGSRFIDEGII